MAMTNRPNSRMAVSPSPLTAIERQLAAEVARGKASRDDVDQTRTGNQRDRRKSRHFAVWMLGVVVLATAIGLSLVDTDNGGALWKSVVTAWRTGQWHEFNRDSGVRRSGVKTALGPLLERRLAELDGAGDAEKYRAAGNLLEAVPRLVPALKDDPRYRSLVAEIDRHIEGQRASTVSSSSGTNAQTGRPEAGVKQHRPR